MASKKEETLEINIPKIDIRRTKITIIGDTPIIMNKFSEKAKRQILDKQQKKAKKDKEVKNEWECFIESMHWLEGKPKKYTKEAFEKAMNSGKARIGFPAVGVKQAALSAAYRAGYIKNKVCMQGAFHIQEEFIDIKYSSIKMREDYVKIPMGGADIVFRGELDGWSSTFEVTYDANVLSVEQLIQFINYGGYAVGIGEWRPEKTGNNGMFHVATSEDLKIEN